MRVGRPQEVLSGQTDTIEYRFLDADGAPQTPTNVTVAIESPSGEVLQTATTSGVTISDSLITYQRTWDAANYPPTRSLADTLPADSMPKENRNFGYKATWVITYGGSDYTRLTYFEPVNRHFLSQLSDADLTELFPQLQKQLTDPTNGTFAAWRNKAWEKIAKRVERETGRHPGDTFLPEEFFECHRQRTLQEFFFTISRREGDVFWERYQECKQEADAEYRLAMGMLSMDDNRDKQWGPSEKTRRRLQGVGR